MVTLKTYPARKKYFRPDATHRLEARILDCSYTKVTDLSPLKGMPLVELRCEFKAERDAELLRSIKTLKTINLQPAKSFWKDVDSTSHEEFADTKYPFSLLKREKHSSWGCLDRGEGKPLSTTPSGQAARVRRRKAEDLPVGAMTLRVVDLMSNQTVTNASLRELAGLEYLRFLDLRFTNVTDAGLKQLAGLKSLETLWLQNTAVTAAGVQELQKALPGCKIVSDHGK